MAGRQWKKNETEKLVELKQLGQDRVTIARNIGRTTSACDSKWDSEKAIRGVEFGDTVTSPIPEVKPAEGTIRENLADFQAAASIVKCHWNLEDQPDAAAIWKDAEERNARHILRSQARHRFSVEFTGADPIAISVSSDQHIAIENDIDLQRMRHDAEFIRETVNMFSVKLGDGVDNHIKHRAAMLAARSQPSEQYLMYEHYLSIEGPKILALISGNHDAWTEHFAGVDMVKWIADRQRICYAPAEARLYIKVGTTEYKLAMRHQYRFNSSFNQTHAVKQWQRNGEEEFDIGCIGHHHEPAAEVFNYRGKPCWACRPGSYQISSSYSRQFGYNSTYPTCPTFILYPDRRKIVGFDDMRDAGTHLEALLGKKA